jgi:hypothetical protein
LCHDRTKEALSMFTTIRAMTLAAMCALPMLTTGTGQNGSREAERPSTKSDIAVLDYDVQTATKRVYHLKWDAGARRGSLWCKMEVAVDKHESDPNDSDIQTDLLDLVISYSEFGYAFQKPRDETVLDSQVREAGFDRFTYVAVIDKYGRPVSSDLAAQMAPLRKSAGEAEWAVMAALLEPAISCTWLCVFPKLGPFEQMELVGRDIRDWSPLGVPRIVNAMGHADTAARFHIVPAEGNRMILWSKTMRQEACAEYLGTDNVSITTKIEITYSGTLRAVEGASWKRAWSFEKAPQEDSSGTFLAILRNE